MIKQASLQKICRWMHSNKREVNRIIDIYRQYSNSHPGRYTYAHFGSSLINSFENFSGDFNSLLDGEEIYQLGVIVAEALHCIGVVSK